MKKLLVFIGLAVSLAMGCSKDVQTESAGDATVTPASPEVDAGEATGEVAPPAKGPVVARVNGVDILRKDYESTLEHAERTLARRGGLSAADQQKLEEQILQKMIGDELLVQHAHELGLSVSDDEVTARAKVLVDQGGGPQAMAQFLAVSGLSEKQMLSNLRRNMLVERLQERIKAEISVDEDQLKAHYAKLSSKFSGQGAVELEHLVFKKAEGGQTPTQLAEKAYAALAGGLSWADAMKKYGKQGGGSLGRMQPTDLLPVFSKAIEGLKVGQVSRPVESPMGVHLLHLVSRADSPLRSYEDVKEQVSQDLLKVKFEARTEALMKELQRKGDVRTSGLP